MPLIHLMVSSLVGHLDNLLPYKTGRSLDQLVEDRSVRSVLETLFRISETRITDTVRGFLQLHSLINKTTTSEERRSIQYVHSQLIVLRAITLALYLHWGSLHPKDARKSYTISHFLTNPTEAETLKSKPLFSDSLTSTSATLGIRPDCVPPPELSANLTENLLFIISHYMRDWRPSDSVDLVNITIGQVFVHAHQKKRTENTLSKPMFTCATEALLGRATPEYFAWYCLAIPTSDPLMEVQEAVGAAFHYLSASNWAKCYARIRSGIMSIVSSSSNVQGSASDIRLMAFTCPSPHNLGQLIDLSAEFFGKLQYADQITLVQSLRKAIWNFVTRYSMSYVDLYLKDMRIPSNHIEKFITTLRSMDGVVKQGRAFPGKPLKYLLFSLCPDIIDRIVTDIESGSERSKYPFTQYVHNMRKALQGSSIAEMYITAAIDLCMASVAHLHNPKSSIVRLAYTFEPIFQRILFDAQQQTDRFQSGIETQAILTNIFTASIFMFPDRVFNEYSAVMVRDTSPFHFRMAFIEGIVNVFINATMLQYVNISSLGNSVSRHIRFLLQECVTSMRSRTSPEHAGPVRRGSIAFERKPYRRGLVGGTADPKTTTSSSSSPYTEGSAIGGGISSGSSMDMSLFGDEQSQRFAMIKAILHLYTARPELALGSGDKEDSHSNFQVTVTIVTACLQFENHVVRRLAGTALMELWDPEITRLWAGNKDKMNNFWALSSQMMTIVGRQIILTPHYRHPDLTVWYMQLLRGLLERRSQFVKEFQDIAYIGHRNAESEQYRAIYELMCFCTLWSARNTIVEILIETMSIAYDTFCISLDPDYDLTVDMAANAPNWDVLVHVVKDNIMSSGTYGKVAQQKAMRRLVRKYVQPTAPSQISAQECFRQWRIMIQQLLQASEGRSRTSASMDRDSGTLISNASNAMSSLSVAKQPPSSSGPSSQSGLSAAAAAAIAATTGASIIPSTPSVGSTATASSTSRKKPGFYEKLTSSSKFSSITSNFSSHHRDNASRRSTSHSAVAAGSAFTSTPAVATSPSVGGVAGSGTATTSNSQVANATAPISSLQSTIVASQFESKYDYLKLSWKNCTGLLLSIAVVCLEDSKESPAINQAFASTQDGYSPEGSSGGFTVVTSDLGTLVDHFLRELLDLLVCDDLYIRESVREMLSSETHPDIVPNLISQAHQILCNFVLPSGDLITDDRHTLFVGQVTNIIRSLLNRGDAWPDHSFRVDTGPFILKLARYMNAVHNNHPLAALREKLLFAQLVTTLMSNSVKLSMYNEVNTRNTLLDNFVHWVNDMQRLAETPSVTSTDNISLLRNTILACMKAVVALLDSLPIQPIDGTTQSASSKSTQMQDMRSLRARCFRRYFDFFVSLVTHIRTVAESSASQASPQPPQLSPSSQLLSSPQIGATHHRSQRSESVAISSSSSNQPTSPMSPHYTAAASATTQTLNPSAPVKPRAQLPPHSANLLETCIQALHHLLNSNIEIGLQYSLAFAYSEDVKLRVVFTEIITDILNQGLELECLDEVPISVWQKRLLDQLTDHDQWLLAINEVCQVHDIDELAPVLLSVFDSRGKGLHLLNTIIDCELQKTDSAAELFRRNCLATRLLGAYSKSHGSKYLELTLKPQITKILGQAPELNTYELNPSRYDENEQSKARNLENLQRLCSELLDAIIESGKNMPDSFHQVCHMLYSLVEPYFPGSGLTAVGGFLFLRFLCPALVAPDTHGLAPQIDNRDLRRGLLLCTKVIQNIANDVLFGSKESYMTSLNEFVAEYRPRVQKFLEEAVRVVESPHPNEEQQLGTAKGQQRPQSSHGDLTGSAASIKSVDLEPSARSFSVKSDRANAADTASIKEDPQSLDISIESFYTLQRFFYDNQTRFRQYAESQSFDSGNLNSNPGNESDSSSVFSMRKSSTSGLRGDGKRKAQKLFDQLFYIMQQLGPPPNNPSNETRMLARAAEANNSLFYDVLKRDAHINTDPIAKKRIFYIGGPSRDRRPILYVVTRRLQAQYVDMDLVMLQLLRLLEPFTRAPFEIFFDITQFGIVNEISSQWLKQLQIILPPSITSNIEQVYWYNINSHFRKFVKSEAITLPSRIIRRSILPTSLSIIRDYINSPDVDLPPGTVSLDKEVGVTVMNVLRLNRQQPPMSCNIKITPDAIQIQAQKKQEIFGINALFNDVFHITEVADIQFVSPSRLGEGSLAFPSLATAYPHKYSGKGAAKGHSKHGKWHEDIGDHMLVLMRFEGANSPVVFSSHKAELIYKAVRSARAQYEVPVAPTAPERMIRPTDVPGTLLNICFHNCGSEDSSLRMASYSMLHSLVLTFSKFSASSLIMAPELCPPPNSINFIASISTAISEKCPELTLELLSEALKQFPRANPFLRQWTLHYIQPWMKNLSQFYRFSPSNPDASRKTRDLIRELIRTNIQKPALYHHFKTLIWATVAVVEELVDLVLDLFISMGIECSPMSVQTEMLSDLLAHIASINPRYNKLPVRLRKLLSLTSSSPTSSLTEHSTWPEIQVILRYLLAISFENKRLALDYLPEIAYITCMLLGTGSVAIRLTLHGIVLHCIHSLIMSVTTNSGDILVPSDSLVDPGSPIAKLLGLLSELSEPHIKYQFGLKQRPATSEAFVVNSLGKTSTSTLANAYIMAGSPFQADDTVAAVVMNRGVIASVERIVQFFLNVMSCPVFDESLGDEWRSRWTGLVSSTTFLYNPALQPRAFATLGQLSCNDEVDDDLLYQTLATLRGTLLRFRPGEDDLAVSVITCMTKLIDHMPEDSAYLVPMFWLAITIAQIGHPRLFSAGISLLSRVISTLDLCGAFTAQNGGGFAAFVMAARAPVEDVLTELENRTEIHFQSSFSIALATVLVRGFSDSSILDDTFGLVKLILNVCSRARQRQNAESNPECIDTVVPYLTIGLPIAATKGEFSSILSPPSLNLDIEDAHKFVKSNNYVSIVEALYDNDQGRVIPSYNVLCATLMAGMVYQSRVDQALTVLYTLLRSNVVFSDIESGMEITKSVVPCINEILRTRTMGPLLGSVYNLILSISYNPKVQPGHGPAVTSTSFLQKSPGQQQQQQSGRSPNGESGAAATTTSLNSRFASKSGIIQHNSFNNSSNTFLSYQSGGTSDNTTFQDLLPEHIVRKLDEAGFSGMPRAFAFDSDEHIQIQIAELAASLIDRIL
ncbi:Ras GTPase activating protein ira2 [Spiromyces aspiralis]|uniref:Ras GTPase activating protein ira2 n=1 Tax=Spiromyces aspiralis TaxID=68401 RepID=A0ACC1HGS2_9FUNG|nr:Ras GTPase activating protein ira2 [Spiromyces aspiralis]